MYKIYKLDKYNMSWMYEEYCPVECMKNTKLIIYNKKLINHNF